MAQKRIPYFRFYPSDFMRGVRGMTAQEVGLYTMLLCRMYEESEPIEDHALRLSTYCGMRQATFEKTLQKLVDLGKIIRRDGTLWNDRAEIEISHRAHDLKIAIKAGKVSAEKRQQKQRQDATTVQRPFNHTDTDTDTDIIPIGIMATDEKQQNSKPKKRRPELPLPDGWTPDIEKARRVMDEYKLTRDEMNFCYKAMEAHAHANDRRQRDWDAAYRNWVVREIGYGNIGPNSKRRKQAAGQSSIWD